MDESQSHSDAAPHLDAEELAVFLEGNLSAERAARLRQHIAGCEDCYELFVTSAEAFEEMEPPAAQAGRFRPAAEPAPRWLRPLAFAAMVALAVTTGFLVYRQLDSPAGSPWEQAIAQLEDEDARHIEAPPSAERSSDTDDQLRLAFGLGVESVHLALQERAGDQAAGQTLTRLRGLWNQLGVKEIPNPFDDGPGAALKRFEKVRQRNAEKSYFDPLFFRLGLWTEGGRLAAAAGRDEYFQSAFHRDTQEYLLHEPALEPRIRPIQEKRTPDPQAFQAIRDAYDPGR